jgi:hypothetical protein
MTTTMIINQFESASKILPLSFALLADSDTGESKPERAQLLKKIDSRKHRKIPVAQYIVLLLVIVLAVMVLEYFI